MSTSWRGETDGQQDWWDSMGIAAQIKYVTKQHEERLARFPQLIKPNELEIKIIEIEAAAAADKAPGGRGPLWYGAYVAELEARGVVRRNGYNYLAEEAPK